MTSQPQINNCRHIETNPGNNKLPRQIYSKLPQVPFKSQKNVLMECYNNAVKDLRSMFMAEKLTYFCNFSPVFMSTGDIP